MTERRCMRVGFIGIGQHGDARWRAAGRARAGSRRRLRRARRELGGRSSAARRVGSQRASSAAARPTSSILAPQAGAARGGRRGASAAAPRSSSRSSPRAAQADVRAALPGRAGLPRRCRTSPVEVRQRSARASPSPTRTSTQELRSGARALRPRSATVIAAPRARSWPAAARAQASARPTWRCSPRPGSTPPSAAACPADRRARSWSTTMAGSAALLRDARRATRSRVRRSVTSPGGVDRARPAGARARRRPRGARTPLWTLC